MSKDTIYREDAIKALYKYRFVSKGVIEREIKAIPSADRPSGHWCDSKDNVVLLTPRGTMLQTVWCSECSEWLIGSDEYECNGRYCPNCGARMKGADDE